jgi:hypothetical protein
LCLLFWQIAGVQLPHSHNPLSEAVNVLLANAGLTSAGTSSISQLGLLSPAGSMAADAAAAAAGAAGGPFGYASRQHQQQYGLHQRHRSYGAYLANGQQQQQVERSGVSTPGLEQQQHRQQQHRQQQRSDAEDAAAAVAVNEEQARLGTAAGAAGGRIRQLQQENGHHAVADDVQPEQQQQQTAGAVAVPGERVLQRSSSSGRWSRDLRENAWMLEFDALGLDPHKRRVIGSGSYGELRHGFSRESEMKVYMYIHVL